MEPQVLSDEEFLKRFKRHMEVAEFVIDGSHERQDIDGEAVRLYEIVQRLQTAYNEAVELLVRAQTQLPDCAAYRDIEDFLAKHKEA